MLTALPDDFMFLKIKRISFRDFISVVKNPKANVKLYSWHFCYCILKSWMHHGNCTPIKLSNENYIAKRLISWKAKSHISESTLKFKSTRTKGGHRSRLEFIYFFIVKFYFVLFFPDKSERRLTSVLMSGVITSRKDEVGVRRRDLFCAFYAGCRIYDGLYSPGFP